jgi:fucose-1-phosphate guanylyltransferase
MIDMLMAMFIEFPADMIPGILLVCPDTFELFNTDGEKCCFTEPGFTALAHPSPIDVGTTHGVFVLENNSEDMVIK